MTKKIVFCCVFIIFFGVFHGFALAKCLPEADMSPDCRYRQGDAWCNKNGKGNLYAYTDSCLQAKNKSPRETWDSCIAKVKDKNSDNSSIQHKLFEICGYAPEPTSQELALIEKSVLIFCDEKNEELPTIGDAYRAYIYYDPNGAAIKQLAEKCAAEAKKDKDKILHANKDKLDNISSASSEQKITTTKMAVVDNGSDQNTIPDITCLPEINNLSDCRYPKGDSSCANQKNSSYSYNSKCLERHYKAQPNQENKLITKPQENKEIEEEEEKESDVFSIFVFLLAAIGIIRFYKKLIGIFIFFAVVAPIVYLSNATGSDFKFSGLALSLCPLILVFVANYAVSFFEKREKIKREKNLVRKILIQQRRVQDIVENHLDTLVRKKKQLIIVDDYGNIEDGKWKNEISYFISKTIKPTVLKENVDFILTDNEIFQTVDSLIKSTDRNTRNDIDVDDISPIDYEHYCADLLRQNGWDARTTQATGDQGVDVIASKKGHVGAIQCKKYSTPVGNKAVQEVYAGMQYIGAHFCAVVTNAGYTRSAKQLAQTLGVLLLHHDELILLDEKSGRGF